MYFRLFSRWPWCAPTTILWNCLLRCREYSFPMFAILAAIPSSGCSLATKLGLTLLRPHGLACWAPLSMGFCRQEYWSGLPFPIHSSRPQSKCHSSVEASLIKLDRKHPSKHPLVSYNVLWLICLCIIHHSMMSCMYMRISNRCSTTTIAAMALYSSLYAWQTKTRNRPNSQHQGDSLARTMAHNTTAYYVPKIWLLSIYENIYIK